MIITKLDANIVEDNSTKIKALVYLTDFAFMDKICNRVKIVDKFSLINAVGIEGNKNEILTLTYLPYVKYVSSVAKVYSLGNFEQETMDKYANIMNNFFSTNDYSGRGLGVAVIDTGVNRHVDLCCINNRIILQKDLENNNTYPYDDNGHGTFVAGIVSGNGVGSAKKIMGVCPNANVISVKIMNENGESDVFKALSGMEWVSKNYEKYNIKVAVMSFGAVPQMVNDPLVNGVEALVEKGITVVCASGNSGVNTYMSPAVSSKVISVGAVDENQKIAEFTSRGIYEGKNYPYVYARGVKVVGLSNEGGYALMSGTSVACPIVAGFCLLLREKFPEYSPEKIKDTILQYCKFKDNIYCLDI